MATMGLILSGPLSARGLAAAKAKFSQWDKRLNAVYVALKKTLPEGLFEKVRSDQRDWVEHRDYIAEWDSRAQGEGAGRKYAALSWRAGLLRGPLPACAAAQREGCRSGGGGGHQGRMERIVQGHIL